MTEPSELYRMSSRKHLRTSLLDGRSSQAPGLMRHGPYTGLVPLPASSRPLEPLPPSLKLLENKILAQSAEIDQLAKENHRMATTHVALRQELVAAQQEVHQLKAHIKSTQTESDIQMRVLLDKIAKFEADIRAGESVRNDLQKAHKEAQSLVAARQELIVQIQRAKEELNKKLLDAESLHHLHAELDGLMREHQRLRTTFEYEKSLNIEKVRQMQAMEQNLISMAREVEKLRVGVVYVEKMAYAPNPQGGVGLSNPGPSSVARLQSSSPYVDGLGAHHGQMGPQAAGERAIPYSGSSGAVSGGGMGGATIASASSGVGWAGTYDPSLVGR